MVLTSKELDEIFERLAISEEGRELVRRIRSSPPARNVQGGRGNVCCRYPSTKMGQTIQAESHTIELPAVYQMENDPKVLEYWDQPPANMLRWITPTGRRIGAWHTADFFVIRADWMGWTEWKEEEEIEKLSKSQPKCFEKQSDGRWHYLPGESFARQYGLSYAVYTSRDINLVAHQNLIFLEDYLLPLCPDVDATLETQVKGLFKGVGYLNLADLLAQPAPITSDVIYTMIARRKLYCDLEKDLLRDSDATKVFVDASVMQAFRTIRTAQKSENPNLEMTFNSGTAFTWDGRAWVVANIGDNQVALKDEKAGLVNVPRPDFERYVRDGQIQPVRTENKESDQIAERIKIASTRDLKDAQNRYEIIQGFLEGEPVRANRRARRTIFKYLKMYREAEHSCGNGFIGLLPNHMNKGNRNSRLPETIGARIDKFIEGLYEKPTAPNVWSVYARYCKECEDQNLQPVTFKTFLRRVKSRSLLQRLAKREGRGGAYSVKIVHWRLKRDTPRHGSRPFEIAHIDHTELELELLASKSWKNLGRPWLTLMVDAYSRVILAFHISFEKPSYRACMMVIRECVRRHGRIPQFIVTDNGAEFKSAYYQSLLAFFRRTPKYRPPKQPRFGSILERMFGIVQSQLIHALQGNTKIMRDVRKVTKPVNPKNLAVWTLFEFEKLLEEWIRVAYHEVDHPALGMSPAAALAEGLRQFGEREFTLIPYDETFKRMTCPTTSTGRAKVDGARGVKINYLYYWHESFRRPDVAGTKVEVRYDPYDAGRAYAYVKGHWLDLHSDLFLEFKGRSVAEVLRATRDILESRRAGERSRVTVSARRIAAVLNSAARTERELAERMREDERRAADARFDGRPELRLVSTNVDRPASAPAAQPAERARKRRTLAHFDEE